MLSDSPALLSSRESRRYIAAFSTTKNLPFADTVNTYGKREVLILKKSKFDHRVGISEGRKYFFDKIRGQNL